MIGVTSTHTWKISNSEKVRVHSNGYLGHWKYRHTRCSTPMFLVIRITGDLDVEGTFPQFNNVSGYFNIDQGLTVGITTIGGDLSVDGGTFFYDAAQDSLGLGTQNPDQRLHIYEGSNNPAIVHLENQEGEVYWRTDGDVVYYGAHQLPVYE